MVESSDFVYQDLAWQKQESFVFLGHAVEIPLLLDGDEDEMIDGAQILAATKFLALERPLDIAGRFLLDFLATDEARIAERYGDNAVPKNETEMAGVVNPEGVLVSDQFDATRVVAVLFKSDLEPEHGLAVVFENEVPVEAGIQDIAL